MFYSFKQKLKLVHTKSDSLKVFCFVYSKYSTRGQYLSHIIFLGRLHALSIVEQYITKYSYSRMLMLNSSLWG